jgi:hypothetical protein
MGAADMPAPRIIFVLPALQPPQFALSALLCLGAGLAAIGSAFWHSVHLTAWGAAFSAATAVIGLLPAAHFLAVRPRPPFPFLALTGIFYSIFYGIAPLAADYAWPPPMPVTMYLLPPFDPLSTAAAGWALVGLVLLLAGFWGAQRLVAPFVRPISLPTPSSWAQVRCLAWLALAAHIAYLTLPAVRAIPSLGQLLDPLGYFAYGTLLVMHLERRLPWPEAILAAGLLIAEAVFLFLSTSMAPLVLLGLFLGAVRFRLRDRTPWLAMGLAFVLVVIGYNLASATRLALFHASPEASRAEVVAKVVSRYLSLEDQPFFNPPSVSNSVAEQLSPALRRMNLLVPFGAVVEKSPEPVEYWGGRTYVNLLTSYIPRALWPGKPTEQLGNEFGRRYAIIEPERLNMSVNLPWLVEFYANFGPPGVILGMLAVGAVMALMDRFFNSPSMTSVEGVYGATIIFKLFYQESNLSLMTGSLILLAAALWLYLRVGLVISASGWLSRR